MNDGRNTSIRLGPPDLSVLDAVVHHAPHFTARLTRGGASAGFMWCHAEGAWSQHKDKNNKAMLTQVPLHPIKEVNYITHEPLV